MKLSKTILFSPHFSNSFLEMLPVAIVLRDQYGYRIHFTIDWVPYAAAITSCKELGFDYTLMGGAVDAVPDKTFREQEERRPGWLLNIWNKCQKLPCMSEVGRLVWQLIFQSNMEREARQLLNDICPAVVVSYRDDKPRVLTFLVHIANQRGLGTILFPSPVILHPGAQAIFNSGLGQTVSNLRPVQKWIYSFLRHLLPGWVFKWHGENVLFLAPEVALISWLKGIFPPKPWVRGGGNARFVAVASARDSDLVLDMGIEKRKVLLTGYPPFDRYFGQDPGDAREALCQNLGIPTDTLIVCYAATPLLTGQEDTTIPISFDEFRACERFVVDELLNLDPFAHIIFKIHPRSRVDEYSYLSVHGSRLNLIRDIDFNEVVAGSDLFVSYASSAMHIAMALNKPILTFSFENDEAYNLLSEGVCGIHHAYNRKDFKIVAERAFDECRRKGKWQKVTAAGSGNRKVHDGRSTKRFVDMVHALAQDPSVDPRIALEHV